MSRYEDSKFYVKEDERGIFIFLDDMEGEDMRSLISSRLEQVLKIDNIDWTEYPYMIGADINYNGEALFVCIDDNYGPYIKVDSYMVADTILGLL